MLNSEFFKRKFEENRFIWGSFVLAALVMLSAYIFLGYYPIGDNIILKVDMYHQYGPFHEELRHRLVNGRSFLYSWEGGLGKDFISQFAYYTASPLSLLMVLFPQENMPEALALFVLLKVAFSASFFAFYLKKKFGRNDITIVIFAMMYASMAFITSYYWNVMWLDAVALFPLVALGIESLVKDKKYKMYCISLALTILVNFYIAFIVCVFAALYFLVFVFSQYSWKEDKKVIINRFIHFAILSIIAGGISMILTIPTAVALSHTQASDSTFPTLKVYDNVYQLVTNHFVGARPVVLGRNEDLPNLYTGLLTIMLMPFYYLNTKIKLKEKVLYSLFLGFMLLCSCVNTLDFLIHGLHFPSNLPHRFTFIYSFAILIMAYKAFMNIRYAKLKNVYIFFGVFVAIIALTEFVIAPLNDEVERVLTDYDLVINAVLGIVYFLFLYQIIKGQKKDISPLLGLIVVIFAECIFSTTTGIAYTGKTVREKYVGTTNGVERAIEHTKELDGNDFNRTDMYRFVTINEGSLYHFKGFSQFSSLAYGNTSQLMEDLGIAATSNSYRLYDPTPLFDSMLNLKYIIKRDAPFSDGKTVYKYIDKFSNGTDEQVETFNKATAYITECTGIETNSDNVIENYDKLSKEQKEKFENVTGVEKISDLYGLNEGEYVYLYENPYVLPLGFVTKPEVTNWITENDSPFDTQNDFVEKATDVKENILNTIPIYEKDVENKNIKITNTDKEEYTDANGSLNIMKYELTNPKVVSSNEELQPSLTATINFDQISQDETKRVFLYVDAGNAKRAVYSVNDGGEQDREISTGRSLIDVGEINGGSKVTLKLNLTRKGEYEKTYRKSGTIKVYAAYFDMDTFEKAQAELSQNPMKIKEYGDDFIKAEVNVDKTNIDGQGFLYTSIPYDDGWTIKVDGQEVEKVAFGSDGLMGVYLSKGNHEIEFSYYPIGFNMGICITIISIAAFGAYIVIMKRKKTN